MNKQELIERIEGLKNLFGNKAEYIEIDAVIELISELYEPEKGHADEAPRYVKNILARLRELPEHDREVWLKAIMGEFERDFSRAKWREGYEQGKFEGAWVGNQLKDADKIRQELNKPVVPQFVADWYEEHKKDLGYSIWNYIYYWDQQEGYDFKDWFDYGCCGTIQTLFNMHQFGYEVEKEKRYLVKMKNIDTNSAYLKHQLQNNHWYWGSLTECGAFSPYHTKKELEADDFGWVFDCEGIEIEEVKE